MTGLRLAVRASLAIAFVAGLAPAAAQEAPGGGPDGPGVIVCDDLVALRRLTAAAPDPGEVRGHLAEHPGCRAVARTALGAVERRAMVGGAPFECLTPAAGGACLWVMP